MVIKKIVYLSSDIKLGRFLMWIISKFEHHNIMPIKYNIQLYFSPFILLPMYQTYAFHNLCSNIRIIVNVPACRYL